MSIFAKNKTLRSYPSMGIFNVSKFGSLVNFQCQYPRRQSWNRHRLVLLHQTPLKLSLLSKVSIYNLTGKKEKMTRRLGGRLFEEIRYLLKVGEFVQTFV